jgi:formylglycine-generating enzyme required for sulfatase activity
MPENKPVPKDAFRENDAPEDRVHLPPVLGIRPGVYLTGLYALLLLVILFFILLYPGITNPGSLLAFNSEPQGAAVRVDGITVGSTPCELFVPAGDRLVELVLPGFTPQPQELTIPGRVFASLLFPQKIALSVTLEATKPLDAFIPAAADYARWSFTGEPTASYQIPQDLSEGAYRIGPAAASDPAIREEMQEVLFAAARFAVTKAALRDLLRAQFFTDSGGLSPSPLTLTAGITTILAYLSANPGAAIALAETLPPESARLLENSPWFRETVFAATDLSREAEKSAEVRTTPAEELIRLGNLSFRTIPAGIFIQTGTYPHRVPLESFSIASTGIGREDWERFLSARPQWKRENAAALIEQGLASPGYLDDPLNPSPGVPGISWFAADAYCEWLTESLPPSLAGWEVRLPREAEWEYAASLLPVNMPGEFWEWCADPYAPLDYLPALPDAVEAVSSPERCLRGGSWINPPGSVGIETRASLAPATSSPFVSFVSFVVFLSSGACLA